ncbi:MAG: hypothetical protein H7172_07330 [Ferruginibacter sp.]|nr:hypothetical protein [Rhodoferax sp.]
MPVQRDYTTVPSRSTVTPAQMRTEVMDIPWIACGWGSRPAACANAGLAIYSLKPGV